MKNIIIVDDHSVVRAGIRKILEDHADINISAELEDAAGLFGFLKKNECDIIILDINLPDRSGLEILQELRKAAPAAKVLILSIYPESRYAIRALKLGAAGYMTKNSTSDELLNAVKKISMGGKYVSESLAGELASRIDIYEEKALHNKLSAREMEVLLLIGEGKTTAEIAAKLFLSPNTVGTYRARILEKMNMNSTAELIHYVVSNLLIN